MKPMMKCGHAANGRKAISHEPVCIICNCEILAEVASLENRKAKCCYGCDNSIMASRTDLPFFESKPTSNYDKYYCGCHGWE